MNLPKSIQKFFIGPKQFGSAIFGWASPREWTDATLLQQYRHYAYPIISAIAEEAAKVTFEVGRRTTKDIIPVQNHPFLQLMERPNPMSSQFSFLEMHFTFMKLTGESFWYVVKGESSQKPKEIYLLRPDLVKVIVDEESEVGMVKGYRLDRGNGQHTDFSFDEVIHHKMPNPQDPYSGLGPIQAGQTYVETEKFASNWTRNSIYNSGRPSGIINIKGAIEPAQFDQLKKQFKQEYSGTENAGKTLLLKGMDKVDFEKLGMELDGAAMKEIKDISRDDIMMMLRVSKTMLGISEGVTVSNAQENRIMFIENLIKPELDRLVDSLQRFMMPMFGSDYVLGYEDPKMESDLQKREMYIAGHNKWLTTNDIRLSMGLDPLVGGDVIREPVQLVPTSTEKPVKPMKMLKKKAGQPQREERVVIFHKLLFDTQIEWEGRYKRYMQAEFHHQLVEILARKSKAIYTDWIFDVDASKERILGKLVPFGLELMSEAARFAFDIADDPDRELELNEAIQTYVHERVDRFATATNDETIRAIEEAITEGLADGESIAQLKDRIQDVYAYADNVRAERIARTETLAASNSGANEAYKQSPMVAYKEWSAEGNACEFCSALNGKIVGLSEDFAGVGGSVEGDGDNKYQVSYETLEFPPLHPNCRCAILPVSK